MALEELYREVILDHYRNPRNRGRLDSPDATAEGVNPMCGDELILDLAIENDVVTGVGVGLEAAYRAGEDDGAARAP